MESFQLTDTEYKRDTEIQIHQEKAPKWYCLANGHFTFFDLSSLVQFLRAQAEVLSVFPLGLLNYVRWINNTKCDHRIFEVGKDVQDDQVQPLNKHHHAHYII